MQNPFTKHPKENGMNYLEHFLFSLGVAASGGWIWGFSVIHAFFPFLFKKSASKEIESLHQLMERRKK